MKELSIIITVIPLGNMKRSNYRFVADTFDLVPTQETSPGGTVFNCDKELVIDLPDTSILAEFSTPRYACIDFRDSSGRNIRIGTTDIPARVSICPYLNSARLKIESKMLKSPFLAQ